MADVVITAEGLSKKYLVYRRDARYVALRDVLGRKAAYPFRLAARGIRSLTPPNSQRAIQDTTEPIKSARTAFWALDDVSFTVERSNVVGIIGRNGAGKSTLLKILSRITPPTRGRVRIRGRMASLLEVGTGFHPELTGRENIMLNGAILGMSRKEITKHFDAIVEFAGVEAFIDTPVKRYSSGMYVRLAFAVAAHLDPEILIIDEVLAVGDAEFQKKCLRKLSDISRDGRTVLFVSHNMNAIEQLCDAAMLLEGGTLRTYTRDVRACIRDYLFGHEDQSQLLRWTAPDDALDNPWFAPLTFSIGDENGNPFSGPISNDQPAWVYVEGFVRERDSALTLGYAIYSDEGLLLYWTLQTDSAETEWPALTPGRNTLRSRIPARLLNEGSYRLELMVTLHFRSWLAQPGVSSPAIFLTIQGGLSDSPHFMVKRPGVLAPILRWERVDDFSPGPAETQ